MNLFLSTIICASLINETENLMKTQGFALNYNDFPERPLLLLLSNMVLAAGN